MPSLANQTQTLQPNMTVRILYPTYAVGKLGKLLSPEVIIEETNSDYWLVQVSGEDVILALLPNEFQVIGT